MRRYVVDQPGVDDDVAARLALHPLAAQSRPGRDPVSLVVVGGHQRLDPPVVDESGGHVASYDVDGCLPATLGQHRGPVDPGDPVGHGRDMRVGLVGHGTTLTILGFEVRSAYLNQRMAPAARAWRAAAT